MNKRHLATGLSCISLVFSGAFICRDYSRSAKTQAVKHAADTPRETMDVPTLVWALESNRDPLKRDAAKVVARIGGDAKDALPALIKALSVEDSSFTHATHTSLITAIGSIGPDARSAVPILMKLVGQPDPSGLIDSRDRAAIKALGQIGPAAEAALPMLLDCLNRKNALNRDATLQALARIGPNSSEVVSALMRVLEEYPFAEQVAKALDTMGPEAKQAVRAYTEEIFDHVAKGGGFIRLKKAQDATFFLPIEAERKLQSLGGLVTPLLREGLSDEHEPVRVISAYSLVDQGEVSPEVIEVLLAALDKPEYLGGAVGKLTKLGSSAHTALPKLRSLAAGVDEDSPLATMIHEAIDAIEVDLKESPSPVKQEEER